MCKPKVPPMPAMPPPRAANQAPQRAGATAAASQRIGAAYGGRNQVPQFALPVLTAKLGGMTTVLGG